MWPWGSVVGSKASAWWQWKRSVQGDFAHTWTNEGKRCTSEWACYACCVVGWTNRSSKKYEEFISLTAGYPSLCSSAFYVSWLTFDDNTDVNNAASKYKNNNSKKPTWCFIFHKPTWWCHGGFVQLLQTYRVFNSSQRVTTLYWGRGRSCFLSLR